jgi:hypothetical protein
MTLPRTVADVLADHVVFEVACVDRMYCNVHVPKLQFAAGLLGYVQRQLGLPIASTAPLGKITDGFSAAMRRFARDQQVPWVDFVKGQRKDEVMHQHLAGFDREEGVLFIGRAQEKPAGRPRVIPYCPDAECIPRISLIILIFSYIVASHPATSNSGSSAKARRPCRTAQHW